MSRETIYGDRTVHAVDGELQIVRYNRAGKWYAEYVPPRGRTAHHITLNEAVELATAPTAIATLRLPGGGSFDRAVLREMSARIAREGTPQP